MYPPSFFADGFLSPDLVRRNPKAKSRRLMITTSGPADSGKTEFALSAPGPGLVVCLDRGFDAMYDNPKPPSTRRPDFAWRIIKAPTATDFKSALDYAPHWVEYYVASMKALKNPDALTVVFDGDSDSWALQRLAEHGKLQGVFPQTLYTDVYYARKAFYNKMWDSEKIVIATQKLRREFVGVVNAQGQPVYDEKGQQKKEPTDNYIADGYPNKDYLWQIELLHLHELAKPNPLKPGAMLPEQWGVRIVRCKANSSLVGGELWGADCCFATLVQTCYPQVPLSEWGFTP